MFRFTAVSDSAQLDSAQYLGTIQRRPRERRKIANIFCNSQKKLTRLVMQIMKPYGIQLQYANSGGYSYVQKDG